jgi:hypothetical protein
MAGPSKCRQKLWAHSPSAFGMMCADSRTYQYYYVVLVASYVGTCRVATSMFAIILRIRRILLVSYVNRKNMLYFTNKPV